MMKRKYIYWAISLGFVLSLILIIFADSRIKNSTHDKVFNRITALPANKVGLLLGTSKFLRSGKPNQYFQNRIWATVELYRLKKIKYIVISGDNSRKNYNEPEDMKVELLKYGIPENSIFLDYAGFRTFDSVYRMNEIFGQVSFTIISQEFHNERAIYIGQSLNLKPIGFNAKDVDVYNGIKTKVREKFARVKMLFDLCINKKPKFLGDKIKIE